jgi:hypothetical protein
LPASSSPLGLHRVHDTQTKRLRYLNFFQHECYLEVRTPRDPSLKGLRWTLLKDRQRLSAGARQ